MCGRFSLFAPLWFVEERFEATFAYPYERRYNAAPGQALPVIADERPDEIQAYDWGLIPTWADDRSAGSGRINARAETVDEKASFRDAFAGCPSGSPREEGVAGRCLVLADGFYEWGETADGKRPYRVSRTDGEPFAMAGLWTRWRPPTTQTGLDEFGDTDPNDEADAIESFAIVTTDANDIVGEIHDRMPVVLPADRERWWLTADAGDATDLLEPAPAESLEIETVSLAVNDPSNDSPEILTVDSPG